MSVSLDHVSLDGSFEGYASVFGAEDMAHDVVMPGAFSASLATRGRPSVKLLFQHDPAQPIGVWLELAEDAKGLYVRGRLMPEVAKAREVLSLMRAGAIDGLSIGFRTVKAAREARSGIRRLARSTSGRSPSSPFRCCRRRASDGQGRPFAGACRRNVNSSAGSRGMLG